MHTPRWLHTRVEVFHSTRRGGTIHLTSIIPDQVEADAAVKASRMSPSISSHSGCCVSPSTSSLWVASMHILAASFAAPPTKRIRASPCNG